MELTELQKHKKLWIEKAVKGLCTNRQCAMELNLCIGHIKALKRRYKQEGDSVFIHGNTGRKPKHTMPDSDLMRIIQIKESINQSGKKIFNNVNFTAFTRILKDVYGIDYSRNTISTKLKEAGYISPKTRKQKRKKLYMRFGLPDFALENYCRETGHLMIGLKTARTIVSMF